MRAAIDRQYRAELSRPAYFAAMFPLGDVFGAIAMRRHRRAGVTWGPGWGLDVGVLIAFLFLVNLLLSPIAELTEILDQTQTALAGWRKVLGVLDHAARRRRADGRAVDLPAGPLGGRRVAASGSPTATGCRCCTTSTFGSPAGTVGGHRRRDRARARRRSPSCCAAWPTRRRATIRLGDVDLRDVAPDARRRAVRMVPQDGFLFDTTIAENVRIGRAGRHATTRCGPRSAHWASAGGSTTCPPASPPRSASGAGTCRWASASWWRWPVPSWAIRACSSWTRPPARSTPETERALAEALERLSAGRTMVSIAHRLSTAETADLVLVFDDGRIVERGTHAELVAAGGTYAGLYESWLGNTRVPAE